jgi:ubiquinone/menaquinone biosynthesis C-methylase UbiE
MKHPVYVLGHAELELRRLERQHRLIGPSTRAYLQAAGVAPGMRVLDVGSGSGLVSLLAAELVGSTGEVVGIDRAPTAVAAARAAAAARALENLSFREGDPIDTTFERPFDAIVGRYVLLFQTDASALLRALARHLRPGGVIVFHEPDWSTVQSDPVAPTYDRCCGWIVDTFARAGTSTNMRSRLHRAFLDAGLPPPAMRMQTTIGDASGAAEWLRAVADLAIALTPAMEQHHVATSVDIGADSLANRLVQEVASGGGIVVGRSEIGAWSRG